MRRFTHKCVALLAALTLLFPGQAHAVKIVVDAGHGDSDPGAIGVNGLKEKDVNLDVAKRLRDKLLKQGYEVVMTRESDVFLKLAERVELTNRIMPDLFVSVHANSYVSSKMKGTLVLYYDRNYPQEDYPASAEMAALTPESKRLAQLVQDSVVEAADTVDKGIVPSAVYVVRMGEVPSILVETAFLSNPDDASNLADPSFLDKLAEGIAAGIEAYKPPNPYPPGGFPDVPFGYWALDDIMILKDKGIVKGDDFGLFRPKRGLTRAEFVTMLERQFTLPDIRTADSNCTQETTVQNATYGSDPCTPAVQVAFSDLPDSHWAIAAMESAVERGLLQGYPDGTVRPDQIITRGEAAALIDRVAWPNEPPAELGYSFPDVSFALWSAPSIKRLKDRGIITGTSPDTFEPKRPITRAEMSVILNRLIP